MNFKSLNHEHSPLFIHVISLVVFLSVTFISHSAIAEENGFSLSVSQDLSVFNLDLLDQHTQMGTRVGYRVGQLQPFAIFDLLRLQFQSEETSEDCFAGDCTQTSSDIDGTASLFTFGAGIKYLLRPIKKETVQTYMLGGLYVLLPTAIFDGKDLLNDVEASDFGVFLGFGAQYSISERFSVGAEVGLNHFSTKINIKDDLTNSFEDSSEAGESTDRSKFNNKIEATLTQIYSGVHLEFVL